MQTLRNLEEIATRATAIRRATPDILEELFEQQGHVCDLCNRLIENLLVASLDHSLPVILFARGPLPLECAIAQANAPANLRAVHGSCNSTKRDMPRKEWFATGRNITVAMPKAFNEAVYRAHCERHGAATQTLWQLPEIKAKASAAIRAAHARPATKAKMEAARIKSKQCLPPRKRQPIAPLYKETWTAEDSISCKRAWATDYGREAFSYDFTITKHVWLPQPLTTSLGIALHMMARTGHLQNQE